MYSKKTAKMPENWNKVQFSGINSQILIKFQELIPKFLYIYVYENHKTLISGEN